MKYLIFLISFLFEIHENYSSSIYNKPVPEVIESYGYPSQTHSIYTEDGYNLILHRIPYGRHCKKEKSTPVLLVHGIFLSSLSWLFLGPENSLGFLLADNCYDVWLANSRGNCYSRDHKYLSRKDPKYWDFDWHEMGVHDITSSVEYIVDVTKQKDVLYIGVSQSGTSGLVNAILRPETKIKAYFLMAPISYLTKSISPLRALGPAEPIITILTVLLGNFEVSLNFPPLQTVEKFICDIVPGICSFPFGVCGYDPINMNRTASSELLTHSCGISIKQLLHYFQGFNFVEFSQYNYGGFINRIKYGTYIVPKYKVETIKKPVYVYHGRNDLCVDSGDLGRLVQELGDNLARVHLIDDPLFDHLVDYVAHNRAKELIYDELLSDMSKVSN